VSEACEQRGEDGPADAWQRIEDRHVTLLRFLPRCGLPVVVGNWLRKCFAEPVELPLGVSELSVCESYSLDQTTDASGRGLYGSWRNCQSGLAQLGQHMGRILQHLLDNSGKADA
jgi:hypothetical protein